MLRIPLPAMPDLRFALPVCLNLGESGKSGVSCEAFSKKTGVKRPALSRGRGGGGGWGHSHFAPAKSANLSSRGAECVAYRSIASAMSGFARFAELAKIAKHPSGSAAAKPPMGVALPPRGCGGGVSPHSSAVVLFFILWYIKWVSRETECRNAEADSNCHFRCR